LPDSIANLTNIKDLFLENNKLKSIPREILKIKNATTIDDTSYEINNLDPDCEFIILSHLRYPITNLPFGLKEIWVFPMVDLDKIKIPFGCKIIYIN
jgi:Leucine-rich repeat (LRR) protein